MRHVKHKAPSFPFLLSLLVIGFGAGYTVKEFAKEFIQVSPQKAFEAPAGASPLTSFALAPNSVAVCFTPNKQCQLKIIHEINNAKKSILVQAYSFTDNDIANALSNAAKRGINVKVLLDKSNRNKENSVKNIFLHQKIPCRFDVPHGIAHNKIMIIDEERVISGSYNFSTAAYKKNTENVLVINNPALAQTYKRNWQNRWRISTEEAKPPLSRRP
jgi:phosphatidylserine/phosphatidylglycerophosphate/cardiolipin synthase-like enzyme